MPPRARAASTAWWTLQGGALATGVPRAALAAAGRHASSLLLARSRSTGTAGHTHRHRGSTHARQQGEYTTHGAGRLVRLDRGGTGKRGVCTARVSSALNSRRGHGWSHRRRGRVGWPGPRAPRGRPPAAHGQQAASKRSAPDPQPVGTRRARSRLAARRQTHCRGAEGAATSCARSASGQHAVCCRAQPTRLASGQHAARGWQAVRGSARSARRKHAARHTVVSRLASAETGPERRRHHPSAHRPRPSSWTSTRLSAHAVAPT